MTKCECDLSRAAERGAGGGRLGYKIWNSLTSSAPQYTINTNANQEPSHIKKKKKKINNNNNTIMKMCEAFQTNQ